MTENDREERGERVVRCPVEGCDAEHPSRGIHLHMMRSVGDGHGEQGDYPDVDVDDLEEVGRKAVDVDYPEERKSESVARLCPYCGDHFSGKEGVKIHLGQMAGRKNHPEGAASMHEPADFDRVELDENENITAVVDHLRGEKKCKSDDASEPTAVFSKGEIESLIEAMSDAEIQDERLRLLLRRKFLQSLNCAD